MKKLLIVLSMLGCLTSCIKDETKPKPPDTKPGPDTVLTDQKLIGKWNVSYLGVYYFHGDTMTSSDEWIEDDGYYASGERRQQWGDSWISFISFNGGHDFNHYKADGTPDGYMLKGILLPNGTWFIKDTATIELSTDAKPVGQWNWRYIYKDSILGLRLMVPDTSGGRLIDSILVWVKMEHL